ncbi:patatin-like phospholipase family protein [Winogradskyella bathintestinalis]|uniref:Patatin-like phospholipase family protein n=1 Tax=Winogradskyella bathintestinalis TaxID=3035208 RepID=A0ABT7ZWN2_9FLAO|nr:patatin-like phospholipase family protein [Winogradskyella bathintestinalis]MDN3493239.1 patatin-like phospholipase family protein [Winogradskyella bathintestinalis]
MKPYKIGLALSGGGVKGVAHIGVLKVLEEHNIFPDCVSGSSAGAMVGALYASGKKADEIFEIFQKASIFSFSNFAFGKPGLIDLERFKSQFETFFEVDSFESLSTKLFINTTDLVKGRTKVFKKGPLVDTILASSAFPLVFSPYNINGTLYVDGGVVNNFPVEPLVAKCDYILGVYVDPLKPIEASKLTNSFKVLDRVYQITTRYTSLQKFDKCNHIILPQKLEHYGTFDMKKAKEIFDLGYEEAQKHIPVILTELENIKSKNLPTEQNSL